MSRQHSWHAHLRRFAFTSLLLLGVATSAFAQFDRGTITGTVKDAQGGIVPGVTVTLTSTQTQQVRSTVTDGSGFYTFPNLTAGRYEISAELSGFKKTSRSNVQLDAAGAVIARFHAGNRRAHGRGHGHGRKYGAADAGRGPQIGRSQGHRAAVVHRPQPDWRPRAQGGRHRRQLQQRRLLVADQRRIQHQRRPRQRKLHHGRRRGSDPHARVRRDDWRAERRRHPGSPGPHRQLLARVRPRERRADPVRDQKRQQSLHRQRVVLLSATSRCRRTPGSATRARTRSRTPARPLSTTSSMGIRSAARFPAPCSRTSCSSSARRNGSISSPCRPTRRSCRRGDAERRLQPAARIEPVLQHAADHPRSGYRPAVPEQRHPAEHAVAERRSRS